MPQTSLDKFFGELYQSYKDGQKRDMLKDFEKYLAIKKVKYKIDYESKNISKIPTIIVANHFVRPLLPRRSFLTTGESAITSAIITIAAAKLVGKKITWVVKDDLTENVFFLSLKMRKIQLAAIYCYDAIGVSRNYPFGQFEKWAIYLKKGYSIGSYPEAAVSREMKKAKVGFAELLKYLKNNKIKYQILPVSIYFSKSSFYAHVAKPITPFADPAKSANLAMLKIASNLPIFWQGDYKKEAENFKSGLQEQDAETDIGDNYCFSSI